MNGQGEVVG